MSGHGAWHTKGGNGQGSSGTHGLHHCQAKTEDEEAANKKKHLEHENQVREKIGAELDEEIARKQGANRENGNAILSSAAKLLGKGKMQIWKKRTLP